MSTSTGTCSSCGMVRWLGGQGGRCKPCAYPVEICIQCGVQRKIWVDKLCSVCYEDRQVRQKLLEWEELWSTGFTYNSYLMKLYLLYIRRYNLKYRHFRHTRQLGNWFNEKPLEPFQSWQQIYAMARIRPLADVSGSQKGCAWTKIGFMLQELGILPPRTSEYHHRFELVKNRIDVEIHPHIQTFLEMLKKTKRANSTCLHYLHAIDNFNQWLKTQDIPVSLLQVTPRIIEDYLKYLSYLYPGDLGYRRKAIFCFNSFYRFLKSNRQIVVNPAERVPVSRVPAKLTVCDESQVKKIFAFLKNPQSDPQQALLLSLVLIYGWSRQDLRLATLCTEDQNTLSIIHHRTQRTKGRRLYNRPQKLQLKSSPAWFLNLQRRYYLYWLSIYTKAKWTYPRQSLILPPRGNHNRPVSSEYVATLIAQATTAATGAPVPVRILRQTCGHLHSTRQDASLLTRLGWSAQFAFHYTWLPRVIFTRSAPSG